MVSEVSGEKELEMLKSQAEIISQEIDRMRKRIVELEKSKVIEKKIVVRSEKCVGCGICEEVCPQGAISVPVDATIVVAIIDKSKCNLCGLCVRECPNQAIKITNYKEGRREIMPRKDGTGPAGQGPGTGRGMGKGGGKGRMGGFGMGGGGNCVCPDCGNKITHQVGTPCYQVKCPNCGQAMTRER